MRVCERNQPKLTAIPAQICLLTCRTTVQACLHPNSCRKVLARSRRRIHSSPGGRGLTSRLIYLDTRERDERRDPDSHTWRRTPLVSRLSLFSLPLTCMGGERATPAAVAAAADKTRSLAPPLHLPLSPRHLATREWTPD